MRDWYIALTPAAVALIVLALGFVGCTGEDPKIPPKGPDPGPATAPTPAPTPGGPPPPPPPPPAPTRLQLNLASTINTGAAPADEQEVRKIIVYWSLWKSGGVWATVPSPHVVVAPSDPGRDFVDPTQEASPVHAMTDSEVSGSDQASCSCEITVRLPDPAAPEKVIKADSDPMALVPRANHVFILTRKPPAPTTGQEFYLIAQSADGG